MGTHWQYADSFADTNLKMLENVALCDVTLEAGNEKKQIKCHKFILASRSPVFYAMFCGTLAESKDVICLPDIEPSTLEVFLRYLYNGKIEINAATVLSILYAGKKYDIPGLECKCKAFLNENIDTENVCTVLDQAMLFDDEDLKAKSLEFIIGRSNEVLKSDAFVGMSKSGLQEVLKLDTIDASESELYVACKRWAARRCKAADKQETDANIRKELGDEVIYQIRFPAMTLEEFTNVVASENILSEREMLNVYRSIGNKQIDSMFNNKERSFKREKFLFVRCQTLEERWLCNGSEDGLCFTVSKDCKMTAVDLFLPVEEGSVSGYLEILNGSAVIHTQNVTLKYTEGAKHTLVNLTQPIKLFTGTKYTIRQRLTGTFVYYCGTCHSNITMQGLTLSLYNMNNFSPYRTSVSTGKFYGFELLIINKTSSCTNITQ
ncbi:hypothetical protein DPMN_146234 [Dreissena polymorpha]|uniref:BTB domain-containing protein n=2 Tax=Dreissena polymorpha TaxID=45954 RepID=A0A9D4F9Y6_DREPO|nr:hypothetical protein DPMN_146234 [Dreissena polymorpha]